MRKKLFTFLLALVTSVGMSWATDPIVITTNTQQSSYIHSTVIITCDNDGDGDGFAIGGNTGYTATITNLGSSTISEIVLVPGYYKSNHPYVRANGAAPTTSSNDLITFTLFLIRLNITQHATMPSRSHVRYTTTSRTLRKRS